MRPEPSFSIAVLVCGLGLPTFGGDFYAHFLSAVDTNQFTQPLRALSNLVDTNNTGIKVTNTVVDLESLRWRGEISGVQLGMTMQDVVDRWGKPQSGWTRCLHGLITFTYTEVSLGFEGNRLETIHFSPPPRLAGGLSPASQEEDFVRVLGAPTSRFGRNLVYLAAGANLRLNFFNGELASIYLERTPSRAESLPTVRILPEDIVQTSIEQFRSPLGTNQFTVRWTYTEAGARKMLAFWRAHTGEKVMEQVGDFEFRATISTAEPPNWTEERWLKSRTDRFFAVAEEDAKKIVAGLKGK